MLSFGASGDQVAGRQQIESVFDQLSEESLFQLKTLVERRARKQALKLQGGLDPGDLKALRILQTALQEAHDERLNGDKQ